VVGSGGGGAPGWRQTNGGRVAPGWRQAETADGGIEPVSAKGAASGVGRAAGAQPGALCLAVDSQLDTLDIAVSQHHFRRRRQGDEKARVNRSAE
jgi:hypothetical protein